MVGLTEISLNYEIKRQQRLAADIAKYQAQVSSDKRLAAPSDDPQAWIQISHIGQQQADQSAWMANVKYATARAAAADTNLAQINSLFSRAQELVVISSSTADGPGRAGIAAELTEIRATVAQLLGETDYQGNPIFDDGVVTKVPVANGLSVEPVGTRQSVSDGINVSGTPMTLDAILDQVINAVQSGDETQRQAALTSLDAGLDHVILSQSQQGLRGKQLDTATRRLEDTDLDLKEQRGRLEDTDLSEVLTNLQAKITTLQAAQAAFVKINSQTLWDLLK